MTTTQATQIQVPTEAVQPHSLNHLVLNCTNLERSHKFWTEIVGFKEVVSIYDPETGKARSTFYLGSGGTGHHDFALFEIPDAQNTPAVVDWNMQARAVGVNHVAIKYENREEWLKQIAFMQSKDVKFHVRTEHGMTHSAYISDPDGYGIEILYEVPRQAWGDNPGAAVIWARRVAKEGPEALIDNDDYHVFTKDTPVKPDFA
jgi:catechol 2,3-dioxygenase